MAIVKIPILDANNVIREVAFESTPDGLKAVHEITGTVAVGSLPAVQLSGSIPVKGMDGTNPASDANRLPVNLPAMKLGVDAYGQRKETALTIVPADLPYGLNIRTSMYSATYAANTEFERLLYLRNRMTKVGANVALTFSIDAYADETLTPVRIYEQPLAANSQIVLSALGEHTSAPNFVSLPALAAPWQALRVNLNGSPDAGDVKIVVIRR